jgi:hypothetical protein
MGQHGFGLLGQMAFGSGRGDGLAGDLGRKNEEARPNGPAGPKCFRNLEKYFKGF